MQKTESPVSGTTPLAAPQPAWQPQERAAANAAFLSQFLEFDVSEQVPYALLESATRLALTVTQPEKYRKLFEARADHYRNCIKFLCCCVLHLDLATNTIMAFNNAKGLVPAGNSLASNKLNMHRRVVDECIATLKRAGLYLSNERFKYTFCPKEGRVYQGQHSIKRLFLGLFDLVGTTKFVAKAIKRAQEQATIRRHQKALASSDINYGYKKTNRTRSEQRAQRRAEKSLERQSSTATNQAHHNALVAEQIELANKGYSRQEISDHQAGIKIILDDIPY